MKKPLLILLCLIGLSAFNQLSAQNDLDIQNATGCDFNLTGGETDPTGCAPGIAIGSFIAAGASFTVTYTGAPYVVNKFYITDCAANGANLYDYTICGFGQVLVATFPSTACCPSGATVALWPATPGANAMIDIF
jgi:hypothetical protein